MDQKFGFFERLGFGGTLAFLKLCRELYGTRSDCKCRLLDQLELQPAEVEPAATDDEPSAEQAAAGTIMVVAFTRKRPSHQLFPEHRPRERGVLPGPPARLRCIIRR